MDRLEDPTTVKAPPSDTEAFKKRLASGERDFGGVQLVGATLAGLDLREVDLSRANLRGADLQNVQIFGTDFSGADLEGVNLGGARYDRSTLWPEGFDHAHCGAVGPGADLEGGGLQRAELVGADLSGSNLKWANLQRANLYRASLHKASVGGSDLEGANLKWADLAGADLAGADLSLADLRGADLSGALLNNTQFAKARFDGETIWPEGFDHTRCGALGPNANHAGADLQWANLQWADLAGAVLNGAKLAGADLSHASLWKTSLVGADLKGARLDRANLYGADLRKADLTDASLTMARYNAETRWPIGFEPKGVQAVGPGSRFSRMKLIDADLTGANLKDADFSGAHVQGSTLQNASLEGASFDKATLKDVDMRGTNLQGATFEGASFDGIDLRGARFDSDTLWPMDFDSAMCGAVGPGAVLVGADLSGVDLCGADLFGADIGRAILSMARYDTRTLWPVGFDFTRCGALGPGAVLVGIDLVGAYLWRAQLQGTDLGRADLSRANLEEANLEGARLKGARLKSANLKGTSLVGADLTRTMLAGARYDLKTVWPEGFDHIRTGAIGPEANLSGADFTSVSLASASLQRVHLEGACLQWADLSGANASGGHFHGADLQWANLRQADLRGADLTDADLKGAALGGADLTGARLRGAQFESASYDPQTIWPESFDVIASGAVGPLTDPETDAPDLTLPNEAHTTGLVPKNTPTSGSPYATPTRFAARPVLEERPALPSPSKPTLHRLIELETAAIAEGLMTPGKGPPASLAVLGPRGSGRSHAMGLVRAHIERFMERVPPSDVAEAGLIGSALPVEYNAWEGAWDALWPGAIYAILTGLEERLAQEELRTRPRIGKDDTVGTPGALLRRLRQVTPDGPTPRQEVSDALSRLSRERAKLVAEIDEARFERLWVEKSRLLRPGNALADHIRSRLRDAAMQRKPMQLTPADISLLAADLVHTCRLWALGAVVSLAIGLSGPFALTALGPFIQAAVVFIGVMMAGIMVVAGVVMWARRLDEVGALHRALEARMLQRDMDVERMLVEVLEKDREDLGRRLQASTDAIDTHETRIQELSESPVSARLEDIAAVMNRGPSAVRGAYHARHLLDLLGEAWLPNMSDSQATARLKREAFSGGPPRVLLFIDDLDRCPPARVAELLEVARALASSPLCSVVISADPEHIHSALKTGFGGASADLLEKAVDVPFHVPPLNAQHAGVFAGKGEEKVKSVRTTEELVIERDELRHELSSSAGPAGWRLSEAELRFLAGCAEKLSLNARDSRRIGTAALLIRNCWTRLYLEDRTATEHAPTRGLIALLTIAARRPEAIGGLRRAIASGAVAPLTPLVEALGGLEGDSAWLEPLEGFELEVNAGDFEPEILKLVEAFSW